MIHYIDYDKRTGLILGRGIAPTLPQDTETIGYIEHQHRGEIYVRDGIPVRLPPSRDELLFEVRKERDARLANTDKVWSPDYTEGGQPLTEERKNAYMVYRQALRDITTQEDLANLIWPVLQADG